MYDSRFPIELHIGSRPGSSFSGTMTYPDGNMVTSVTGTAEDESDGNVLLEWKERGYVTRGSSIDFNGRYAATVRDGIMNGAWYQEDRRVASFTMTESGSAASVPR